MQQHHHIDSRNTPYLRRHGIVAARTAILALLIAGAVLGKSARAHAGDPSPSGQPAGSQVRGTPAGRMHMQGPRFVGMKPAPAATSSDTSPGPTLVHVLEFRGDYLDARVWTRRTGWSRTLLHARQLVGVHWAETACEQPERCTTTTYRITGAEEDTSRNTMPAHGSNSDVWLYHVEATTRAHPSAEDWRPVCAKDRYGSRKGFFLTSRFQPDGSMNEDGYMFSCSGGVAAKCVRSWGYKPWKSLRTQDGQLVDLAPLHRACVRAARADYCGDGVSYTRNGTMVDIFDIHGFNVRDDNPGFAPEAGFSGDGARWVARTRWPVANARVTDAWTELPRCRRPRAQASSDRPILIEVWSRPRP